MTNDFWGVNVAAYNLKDCARAPAEASKPTPQTR